MGSISMPRPRSVVPSYRLHKNTNQAIVTITAPSGSRQDKYLGAFGSDASIIEYGRVLIEWKAGTGHVAEAGTLTIAEVLLAFWNHAISYYGESSNELSEYKYAIRPVQQLFGLTPATQFGPKALRAVRDRMIEKGLCRKLINRRINRVRHVFRWAVAEELLNGSVLESLQALAPLKRGRTAAPESPRVPPVADADIQAVMPFLSPTVQAMVTFQRCTGCRPGEVVQLCMADVDQAEAVWLYRPKQHKALWKGKDKVIAVGPRAQDAIRSVLPIGLPSDAPVFSPKRSAVERSSALRARRQSKVPPSQQSRRKKRPKKQPGDAYTTETFNKAIKYGIRRARSKGTAVNSWHANQLRHSRATELRQSHGLETASAALGHSELKTTEIYAERSMVQAIRVAAETG
jgi:integrase